MRAREIAQCELISVLLLQRPLTGGIYGKGSLGSPAPGGCARTGTLGLRRPAETLRAAPWRTPPDAALQGALGDSGVAAVLAVLRSARLAGDPK